MRWRVTVHPHTVVCPGASVCGDRSTLLPARWGGGQVQYGCWNESAAVGAWLVEQGLDRSASSFEVPHAATCLERKHHQIAHTRTGHVAPYLFSSSQCATCPASRFSRICFSLEPLGFCRKAPPRPLPTEELGRRYAPWWPGRKPSTLRMAPGGVRKACRPTALSLRRGRAPQSSLR